MLIDGPARSTALTAHDRSLLIEAGAGSGKTAILAGRIAMLLAQGIAPGRIAAVTFTELAASELLARVREFVAQLLRDRVPTELHNAFPHGLPAEQKRRVADAGAELDKLTCSTIHGFCQKLIAPYPVEADMDPGARVIDGDQADLAFAEVVSAWLRERLSVARNELLDEMVRRRPGETVRLVHDVLHALRRQVELSTAPAAPLQPLVAGFAAAIAAFSAAVRAGGVAEEETAALAGRFRDMADGSAAPGSLERPRALVELLIHEPHRDLCRTDGGFRALRKKTAWIGAARRAGLGKIEGERLYLEVEKGYLACCNAWTALRQNAATLALTILLAELRPVIERFQAFKRSAAVLDFDDLIGGARDLLRRHEDVRRALARRHSHILVDEFQDTDLLQIDILWRLCGEPPPGASGRDWMDFHIRPGALFLVGDPKQAIYRFRGADVAAYLRARDALRTEENRVLSVSTNFRSCRSILRYVNGRFELPLSGAGQPGFIALEAFHDDHDEGRCVAALDIRVASVEGRTSADEQRNAEAEAVAQLCARLIDRVQTADLGSGGRRPLRAGDIALLAPTGTDMWRYEEALERHGIPVATQAGKGLYRRQEIQDLIAVTRVLADGRDTLALGALLRGPLVGLTEEELADIVWALPRAADDPASIPRIDLRVSPEDIHNPLARDILSKLQLLRRRVNEVTPHEILAQAVDVLRVRPILLRRHPRQAERALANVDLYLDLSRSYAIRGLLAFAQAMTISWMDESRAVEGRPDSEGDAVALHTMHAAKGLEWPVVVPINTMTAAQGPEKVLVDQARGRLYCPILGVEPVGYDMAHDAEKAELQRERARLWYVAATRAREFLVIPRLDVPSSQTAWACAVDLGLADLPAVDLEHLPDTPSAPSRPAVNDQTQEVFQGETARVRSQHGVLTWLAPSRDEDILRPAERADSHFVAAGIVMDEPDASSVRGGRERGAIIHKLLEEVLNGETDDSAGSLISRAGDLIRALDHFDVTDASRGLSSAEIGRCVERTLALPQIAALRPTLLPEVPVYASSSDGDGERAIAGIVDAFSLDASGRPQLVIDWKSDVEMTAKAIQNYRTQIRAYLEAAEIGEGLLVFVTSGTVIPVRRSDA
jgi:ATP-dependent exoDNAse (exonuclease V) beta subunit